ncbi:CGNR zinc finger domain-containing protein [Cohnella terricola]|uniref:Zinc finger CGNR domain-containing protein n=1 Tax=Cohnella terricola TaxID=1289167 RepID=A0A559J608_9BACL|nr:CGNR zinc finger domain-containing protein [Cohnella terricola]TVX95319.1 hypothetical protein FPZ45_23750 [Cohnella terricola]
MLWDDFMNSLHRDWRGDGKVDDQLENPEWIHEWMQRHRLRADRLPDAEQIASLKKLRERLYRMSKAFVDKLMPEDADMDALNERMALGQVIRRLEIAGEGRYILGLVAVDEGWTAIEAEISSSFSQMLAEGEPSRIRFCDNPNCLWVYYDDTRNRSKRYCDDKMCGNLMKVRRFRARKKAEAAAAVSSRESSDDSER